MNQYDECKLAKEALVKLKLSRLGFRSLRFRAGVVPLVRWQNSQFDMYGTCPCMWCCSSACLLLRFDANLLPGAKALDGFVPPPEAPKTKELFLPYVPGGGPPQTG